jgi:geranylgeranyl pyrophosphate synthase
LRVTQSNNILGAIEKIWEKASAWPEFTQAMRLALTSREGRRDPSTWAALPGLCCQAAGGDPRTADPVAAAWLLFYTAAAIMDHVEDAEQPDPWWVELGAGAAINAATGLYFSACLALNDLDAWLDDPTAASEIRSQVLGRFLVMCSGQHLDLTQTKPSLEQYWQLARAKSGAFFTLACWAGARLATTQKEALEGYSQFGEHAGLLVQILDDLEELRDLEKGLLQGGLAGLSHALPVIYVREVCPAPVKARFDDLLSRSALNPGDAREILEIVESSGGALYLLSELERHHNLALEGLQRSGAIQPAQGRLVALLEHFSPG